MRLEDLNWMDVEKYLQQDDRLILVIGATEQHAYLSLLTDVKIPLALADSASQASGVLVAPALNFGSSPYFLAYPGTLSLRVSTLIAAMEDVVRSAYGHGFRRILIINGHGGNAPARHHLHEVINNLPDLKLNWYDWWLSHSIEAVAVKHQIKPTHANWLEAFPFTVVGEMPEGSKTPPKVPAAIMEAKTVREVYGDGSFGGPYRVSNDVMHELFAAALEDILYLLKFE
ncbi:MAG: creatininase family protein [Chloroflexi bacterium]|nr:creatininase family protein [Chloroflexota bacterium]MBI3339956.1 creatininase family protein [Chloroflexota bacterium]